MKAEPSNYRCPFTVDWVRNQADAEIEQLVLIEVPSQQRAVVVVDVGSGTVAREAVRKDDSKSG